MIDTAEVTTAPKARLLFLAFSVRDIYQSVYPSQADVFDCHNISFFALFLADIISPMHFVFSHLYCFSLAFFSVSEHPSIPCTLLSIDLIV